MNLTNLTKIALKALNNNKLRCFLTMLGIIIGVASVITMLAIGQGSKRSIREQISEMGSNMIMIHPGNMERGGVRQDASSMQTLKLNDYKSISEQAEYVSACSPSVNSSGQFIYGANNYPSTIYGITEDYLDIRKISLEEGSMFTPQDVITSAKVCLIGKTITDNLFPNGESPIGKVIRFNKIPLKVIGTLTPKGYNSMGMDQDDMVLAPYTTVQKRILAITYLQGIYCSALSEELTPQATEEISEILRKNHKIKEGEDDDFEIRSQEELSSMLSSTTDMRYRNHEYHVCLRNGTHSGNRVAHVHRSQRYRYPRPIPYRSCSHQRYRRHYRGRLRSRCIGNRQRPVQMACLRTSLFGHTFFLRLYDNRDILRLVSGS